MEPPCWLIDRTTHDRRPQAGFQADPKLSGREAPSPVSNGRGEFQVNAVVFSAIWEHIIRK
jgi:hypothetical protein